MKYRVLWKSTWKKICIFMVVALSIPISISLYSRYQETGSYEKTFEHMSLLESAVFIFTFSAIISFIVAIFIKFAAVEVKEGYLIGRNYWYFKRRLPLSSITSIDPFSHNGVEAMVADGGDYGKVYIPKQTEKLDELIRELEGYIKKN